MKTFNLLFLMICFVYAQAQQLQDYPEFTKDQIQHSGGEPGILKGGGAMATVPLKFHVIKNGPVFYDDTTKVDALIDTVNVNFAPANIQFEKCGAINYIHDAVYADGWDPFTILYGVAEDYIQENVINVFIPNSTVTYDGYSFSVPSGQWGYYPQFNAVIISGEVSVFSNNWLLTHELGHYFGLLHTSGNGVNPELVDGSNCETAGDFCCDTPAEYFGMCCANIENCEYVPLYGVFTDANGDTLTNPDVKNYMTNMEFASVCPSHFTPDQYFRIQYYYENYLSDLDCSGTVGMDQIKTMDITLAPNPATERLTIQCKKALSNYQFVIYNSTGTSVYSKNATKEIDISAFSRGIYYLRVWNDREMSHSLKFIKQ